jgi:bifunctional non-homologous end joining protein LigD
MAKRTETKSRQKKDLPTSKAETERKIAELVQPERKKRKAASKKTGSARLKEVLEKAEDQPFSGNLQPMLATLADKPFDHEGWIYEVKWDGYRALGFIHQGTAELKSRNDKSFNEKFYPVYDALSAWGIDAVVDGEIVVTDENGISSFGRLQNWRSEADGELLFMLFDILWLDGKDLTQLPLHERREILQEIAPKEGIIRHSEAFDIPGTEFFSAASQMGLEGMIAKRADSTYVPGRRSEQWLKIKSNKRQEVVIGGYTNNEGSSKPFSALLVGVYENGELVYTGKIGTGFNQRTQKEMLEQFRPLIRKNSPFTFEPDVNKPSRFRPNPPKAVATWLEPKLVCEVSYAEMTSDGVMRHPSFEGMREDKAAKDVTREVEQPTQELVEQQPETDPLRKKMTAPKRKKERRTLLNPKDETQVRSIGGHELKFTNLSKEFWPDVGATKRDLLNYYYQAAEWIVPYLKDRPQALNRHPNGIFGKSFYQKDVTGKAPDWIETYLYHSDADNEDKHYLVATDEASLLYMASLGCIEMNPWSSTIHTPDNPDFCVIDLDPAENTFDQVIEAAQVTKQVLDSMGVPSYCKTSGSTGLHIYIPLGARYTYEHSREFGRLIATLVHRELPEFTSIERAIRDRKGKMYIDFLQNRPHATLSCAYSLRPKPGATVSMPLYWEEVRKGLKMTDFTIFNAIDRMRSEGDPFSPVLGEGIDMEKAIAKLEGEM